MTVKTNSKAIREKKAARERQAKKDELKKQLRLAGLRRLTSSKAAGQ